MTDQVLLTTKQAAAHLGWSPSTLAKSRVTGGGPPFAKIGASVRYRLSDLEEWVRQRIRRSTSEVAAKATAY